MKDLARQLIRHEGMKLKPYRDTVFKLTIGVGRNLDDVGISKNEALFMLENDINKADAQLITNLPWTVKMDRIRYAVLCNMAFNMGVSGLLEFKKFLNMVFEGKYSEASKEMLNSLWAKQVGKRALELSEQMETGKYQE